MELAQTERALEIGDSVVEPEDLHLVIPVSLLGGRGHGVLGDSVRPEQLQKAGELVVLRGHHPALSRRDRLDRMKRKCGHVGVSRASHRSTVALRSECVGCILDHDDPVTNSPERRQDRRKPGEAHRDHCPGVLANLRNDGRRIEVPGFRGDVDEPRPSSLVEGTIR